MTKGWLQECIESMIKPSDKNDCDKRPTSRVCSIYTKAVQLKKTVKDVHQVSHIWESMI